MQERQSAIHQFGDITVDAAGMRVRRGSEPVSLEPKSLKVLLYLIENRDRLVTKDELLKAIWQDAFVTDNALTRSVAQIRKALGDDAKQGRIIETVPRLGYRFIAEVIPQASDETVMAPVTAQSPRISIRWIYVCLSLLGLAGICWWIWKPVRPVRPHASLLTRVKQLSMSSGLDVYPSFSPDDGSLAYSSDQSGSLEIYVQPLAPGARAVQVTADGRQNVQPVWSPDGRYIAYHSMADDGIWVIPSLGGSRKRLADFGNAPSWSPDGRRLVFHDRAMASMSATDQDCGNQTSGLWIVDLNGGALVPIPLPDDPSICQTRDPMWISERRILFMRHSYTDSAVGAAAPDGTEFRIIEKLPGRVLSPLWLPRTGSFVFARFSHTGDFTIHQQAIDSNGFPAGSIHEILGESVSVPYSLAGSHDGKRLAFAATLPLSELVSLPLEKDGIRPSGPPKIVSRENIYRYGHPFISPDETRLAFVFASKGSMGNIGVIDIDGGNSRPVATAATGIAGWMPDSSEIAYVQNVQGFHGFWAASLRDGTARRLAPAEDVMFPEVSPDGRQVSFHSTTEKYRVLRKVDLISKKTADLVRIKDATAGFGIWSRDGKQIAFEIQRRDNDQLATVSSGGGPYTEWTRGPGKTWPGSWSADGNTIIAAARRDGVWNVYAIGRDHSERKLTDYTSPREFVRYTRLSPSGTRIVYEYNETKGNIYIGDLSQ